MKNLAFILVFVLFYSTSSFSQGVAINTSGASADANAMLDVSSTTKGVLFPRMTYAQRSAISAPVEEGMLIYQTDNTPGFYYFDGSQWVNIANGFVEADGVVGNEFQDLSYNSTSRQVTITDGTNATIPLFSTSSTAAGLVPGSTSGGTDYYLRADGSWAIPPDDNSTYTAGTGITLNGNQFYHTDLSSQPSVTNSGGNVIQGITLSYSGHVAGITSADMDSRYYLKTELTNPGTLNDVSNPVDWTKLKSVPTAYTNNATLGYLRPLAWDSIWDGSASYYSGSYIDLPPGKWIVNIDLLLRNDTVVNDTQSIWVRATLSESSTTFAFTTDIIGSYFSSGMLSGLCEFGMVSGAIQIENASLATKRYYLWGHSAVGFQGAVIKLTGFGHNWGESNLFGIPVP